MSKRGTIKTLDTQHAKHNDNFRKAYRSLEDYKMNLDCIKSSMSNMLSKGLSNLSENEFQEYLLLGDQQRELEQHVKELEARVQEVDYLLDTADIVFKYYDVLENGADESEAAAMDNNSILKYFVKSGSSSSEQEEQPEPELDRASLLEKYLETTDINYIKSAKEQCDECHYCGSSNRTLLVNDGMSYCNDCYTVETIIVDHEKPSYKDPPKEISYFAYKRINHLNEWISQIQGKESTEIPPEIYDRILLEIKKQRITNMADITTAKIKEILKRLQLNKYYEHTSHIMNRLNGTPSINLTPEIEEKLRQMFKMIQIPFFKYAPKSRKNFLSYSYTIHKCLQLLELDEYLKYFPLLKSREKTFQMDEVWKKICEELNWEFYSSV
jgi:hypothetical protein